MYNYFSLHLSAYRTSYSMQRVQSKNGKLDNNFVVDAVIMDLTKAFDWIPRDLLITKLAAYGFEEKTLLYILFILGK